ncbi:glycoside-pentoside-hexuronide (GPH):cation symporter [Lactiplantibacillus xiangfangensis]|uniref:Xylose-proton symporter n=1 Tax=Lactiplantibacillus xiangfangensis TaxID=942150 RepID=A0A0R2MD10_9LACO|nr:glycoside-pentoside-hexuronide (GPH):cation symporter [Lactiplantibacillus xiangfangensis]KRO11577.1 xylose-proton symporter [Lactiplantibacillus xiangfangensis]
MERVNPNLSKLKLKRSELIIYGMGDFASNLCWTFIGGYLTVFYTDIVGIAPLLTSILIMLARIFDGIWDPVFGGIAERTRTSLGRFRPYIIYGAPFLALFSVLSFTKFGSGRLAIILAFVMYFICGLLFTVVNLSYGSLATVMTTDQDDLAQLSSYRMIGTNLSSVLITAVTPILLSYFSVGKEPDARGYFLTAVVFALIAVPMFWLVGNKCHENVRPVESETKVSFRTTFKIILKNRPLMLLFCIMFIGMLAMFGRIGTLVYYVMYDLKRFDLIAVFMTLPSVGGIIGIYFTKGLVTKVGRKVMCRIGYLGCGISLILMFIIGQVTQFKSITMLIIFDFIYGLFNFVMPIPMAMVADAINYGESKFGVRADGTSYAIVSLSVKLGSAFGASLGLAIMSAVGYIANQQQSPLAQFGINGVVNLVYGALWLLCLIPLSFYPLTEKRNNEIGLALNKQREMIDLTENNLSKQSHVSQFRDKSSYSDRVESIHAMVAGEVTRLKNIRDPQSGQPVLGTGFAILPVNGEIVSPAEGKIINVFFDGHALGIRTMNGTEILIHLGVNTFQLGGAPFKILTTEGESVSVGQKIAEVDLTMLREANCGTAIFAIITKCPSGDIFDMNDVKNARPEQVVGGVFTKK